MIIKEIKIFSQDVWKNNLIVKTILETQYLFDIILIQEPSWTIICFIPSSISKEEDELVGVLNHSNWITFSRNSLKENDSSRVITYINIRLSFFNFSLCKDIFNNRNISLILFFNNKSIFFLMNVYSDSSQSALKYLKDTEANINNVLIMTRDFNIRDRLWDPNYLYYSIYSDMLIDIVESIYLGFFFSTNYISTRYLDNNHNLNSIIGLIFLRYRSEELDKYSIYYEWRLVSDHVPLIVTIPIFKKHIQTRKHMIIKDSDKEKNFVNELIKTFISINIDDISDINSLESMI